MAEIGQCILFATLGLTPSIDRSAAYVAGWLDALAEDNRFDASGLRDTEDYARGRCQSDAA